jgi:hypothetical protein
MNDRGVEASVAQIGDGPPRRDDVQLRACTVNGRKSLWRNHMMSPNPKNSKNDKLVE